MKTTNPALAQEADKPQTATIITDDQAINYLANFVQGDFKDYHSKISAIEFLDLRIDRLYSLLHTLNDSAGINLSCINMAVSYFLIHSKDAPIIKEMVASAVNDVYLISQSIEQYSAEHSYFTSLLSTIQDMINAQQAVTLRSE